MCLDLGGYEKVATIGHGEHAGFEWQIVHNRMGHRCGYVRVLLGHPWFEKGYDDVDARVHGGLTFAQHGTACPIHGAEAEWWVGFDCAHGGDAPDPAFAPEEARALWDYGIVRDQAYVEAECRSLCEQAARAYGA